MRVVIAGASGFIGRALTATLARQGADVRRLVRRAPAGPDEVPWDPARDTLDPSALEGADAVITLAGRTIGRWPWTRRAREEMVSSRVRSTRLLVEAIGRLRVRPSVFVSASAIGYYGDRGDEVLTEASGPGQGFLADLVQAWEGEARRAQDLGVRTVSTRFGLILGRGGGVLAPLLLPFRLGLGGRLGSGRQWWSWVHLDDVTAAVGTALRSPALDGPVNVVTPAPVRQHDFARVLGAVLRRPAVLPVPAFALRLVLREMADETVLASQRVVPARLQAAGFAFRWPDLRPALEDVLRVAP
ncbi:MAG: TIGR01777 family oxidoreductase [Armatimonadota bacterium]|nr:TIGR01777 family oxidoreductase [Armatimonadota bacterium]